MRVKKYQQQPSQNGCLKHTVITPRNNMDNFEEERDILNLAMPLLKKLYGESEIDDAQKDKPDAAIILKIKDLDSLNRQEFIRVGIEITSIDKQDDRQYWNDEKITQDAISDQILGLELGKISLQPNKKMSIKVSDTYISDAVSKKSNKYQSYRQTGNYTELIILAFSEYLKADVHFERYQKPWANYWLSESRCPFDKVIFVCRKSREAIIIYNKKKSTKELPKTGKEGYSIDISRSAIIPMGEKVPYIPFSSSPPLIPKGKKAKRKGK